MPVPIISDQTGLFVLDKDVAMTTYSFAASESPTGWSLVSGSWPTGLSFNTTTGVLSGTPTVAGRSTIKLKATNGSGDSAPIEFNIKVFPVPTRDEDGLIELNWDLQTERVVNPLISEGPILYAKDGNIKGLAIGFVRGSELRTLDVTNIKVTLRDSFDNPISTLYDAAPGSPLDAVYPRYRVLCDFSGAQVLADITEHDGDSAEGGTDFEFPAKCDIEVTHTITSIGGGTTNKRTCVTFDVHVARSQST